MWYKRFKCPLHDDSKPSLVVWVDGSGHVSWKCYVCGQVPRRVIEPYLTEMGIMGIVQFSSLTETSQKRFIRDDSLLERDLRDDVIKRGLEQCAYVEVVGCKAYTSNSNMCYALGVYDRASQQIVQACVSERYRSRGWPRYLSVKPFAGVWVWGSVEKAESAIVVEGHIKALSVLSWLRKQNYPQSILICSLTNKTAWSEWPILKEKLSKFNLRIKRVVLASDPDWEDDTATRWRVKAIEAFEKSDVIIWRSDHKVDDFLLRGGSVDSILDVKTEDSFISLCDVKDESVRWMIQELVPVGTVCVVDGHPGIGKSWLTLSFACAASLADVRGSVSAIHFGDGGFLRVFPGCGAVCVSNIEDPPSVIRHRVSQILSRSEIGGVHPELVMRNILLPRRPLIFPMKEEVLLETQNDFSRRGVKTLIVDPWTAHIQGVDLFNDQQVRQVLRQMQQLASTVIIVRHWRKNTSNVDKIERGWGSIGLAAAVRSIISCYRDDTSEDKVIAEVVKVSYGKPGMVIYFKPSELGVVADVDVEKDEDSRGL